MQTILHGIFLLILAVIGLSVLFMILRFIGSAFPRFQAFGPGGWKGFGVWGFVKAHPWWTAFIIVPLPLWILLLCWFLPTWWNGMVYATVGKTESVPAVQAVAPQGKGVGGPLRWSDNANVEIRKRMTTEQVIGKVAFVSMVPPNSWVDLSFSCNARQGVQWNAFLVSLNPLGFLPDQTLRTHATPNHYARGTVFPLPGLSGPGMTHETRYENYTGRAVEEGFKLNEMYVQISEGGPSQVLLDHKEPAGTFQYEVKVGANKTSLTIPNQNWKWLWIAAVHHPKYRATLNGTPVPVQGVDEGADKNVFGTMASVNGETKSLSTPLLFQPGELTSHIDLFLKVPKSIAEEIGTLEPATIIVGIQL